MNEKEFLSIMQSDSKLWDAAETTQVAGGVTKTLFVPWGIGLTEVTLEGMDSVTGRRAAFGSYGAYIRELVRDKTDDEAITARAETAAARTGEVYGGQPDTKRPSPEEPATVPSKEAVAASYGSATYSADPAIRISELRRERDGLVGYLDTLGLEILALEAYLEIINASGNKKPPLSDSQGAVEESSEGSIGEESPTFDDARS